VISRSVVQQLTITVVRGDAHLADLDMHGYKRSQ